MEEIAKTLDRNEKDYLVFYIPFNFFNLSHIKMKER